MKIKNVILLSFILFLMSCYDDKGNYDYSEMAEIKIENLPETLEILLEDLYLISYQTWKFHLMDRYIFYLLLFLIYKPL